MDEPTWIEASLTVSPELAEAVAEVLGRFTREGVVIEQLANQNTSQEKTILNSEVRVYGFFFNDKTVGERKKKLEEALWFLGRIQQLPAVEYRGIHDQDWMEAWKKQYEPITVGKKLIILPAWIEKSIPGRIPIRIIPGMAFGTGTHPTTQLCLQFMEDLVPQGSTVFDIGCGSGILSIGAVALGASRVYAVDTDNASVRSTRENCEINKVNDRVEIAQGSIGLLLNGHFGVFTAPLVVANILSSVILVMIKEGLADLVEPGGNLLLSGILANQFQEIIQSASEAGLLMVEKKQAEDWIAILMKKPSV